MPAIKNVGLVFATGAQFLDYLDDIKFASWRPRFITAHHTGGPTLAQWQAWQTRAKPVSDEQWLRNLAGYYGNDLGWSSGPHFFFTPKHFCVLSPPEKRGVHAVSFNGLSWGVEMVGNFDSETLSPELRDWYVTGFACLHIATGLKVLPYKYATQGLHFHRNDPKTTKTCAGRRINQAEFATDVLRKVEQMTDGEAPAERPVESAPQPKRTGTVNVPANDELNVRTEPSGKSAVIGEIKRGTLVTITGEAMNGTTKWLRLATPDGWVASRYVNIGG